MAHPKSSTKGVLYRAVSICIILAIMSSISRCCQAEEVDPDDRRRKPGVTCYPYGGQHCMDNECQQLCDDTGIHGTGAFCSGHAGAWDWECCCPQLAV
nr:unnamed protein product [Digitaria exilis]